MRIHVSTSAKPTVYEYSCARLRAAQTLLKLSQIIFRVHPDAVVGRHGYVNVDPILQKTQLLQAFNTFEGGFGQSDKTVQRRHAIAVDAEVFKIARVRAVAIKGDGCVRKIQRA